MSHPPVPIDPIDPLVLGALRGLTERSAPRLYNGPERWCHSFGAVPEVSAVRWNAWTSGCNAWES